MEVNSQEVEETRTADGSPVSATTPTHFTVLVIIALQRQPSRKRRRDSNGQSGITSAFDERLPKRQGFNCDFIQPTTSACYRLVETCYSTGLSQKAFVGLCAYLFTLLHWEYPIPAAEFDNLVRRYPAFRTAGAAVRECQETQSNTPSYHHWFKLHQQDIRSTTEGIVYGDSLYRMYLENPYTFANIEASLIWIAEFISLLMSGACGQCNNRAGNTGEGSKGRAKRSQRDTWVQTRATDNSRGWLDMEAIR